MVNNTKSLSELPDEVIHKIATFLPPQYNQNMRSVSKQFSKNISPLSRNNNIMDFSLSSKMFENKYYTTLFEIKENLLFDNTVFTQLHLDIKSILEKNWIYLRDHKIIQEIRKTYKIFDENKTTLPIIIVNVQSLTFSLYDAIIRFVLQITSIPDKYDYIYYLASLYQQRIDILMEIMRNNEYVEDNQIDGIELGYCFIEFCKICILQLENIKPDYMYDLLCNFKNRWLKIYSKGIRIITKNISDKESFQIIILYLICYVSPSEYIQNNFHILNDTYSNSTSPLNLEKSIDGKIIINNKNFKTCIQFFRANYKTELIDNHIMIRLIDK